jgi:aminoglycoside 6'-N-acetyltransferase I
MSIRPLRPTDQSKWLRLRRALWPDPEEDLEQEMEVIGADLSRQPVFVAQRPEGGLCGFVEVTIHSSAPGCTSARIGYLEAWYVDPDWRRQGLGRRLVETAEAWAKSQGCREMASDTSPDYPLSPAAHTGVGYQEVERTAYPSGHIAGDRYFRKALE